jgi:DNA-binding IclR family transcriptional regulator
MYRYASLLRETGLIEPIGDSRYRLTDAVVGLAAAADAGRTSLIDAAAGQLAELRDAFDETVLVARRGGTNAYCIAREESSHPVRLQFAVGQAMPLHSGSVARILLAAMPERERTSYRNHHLSSLSSGQQALLSETALARVRTDGWTQSREEVDAGIWGCAAAITQRGQVVAALGTAGPLFRLDEERRKRIIDLVRRSASRISAELEGN